jgi:NAD(P)H-hydrate epimerase
MSGGSLIFLAAEAFPGQGGRVPQEDALKIIVMTAVGVVILMLGGIFAAILFRKRLKSDTREEPLSRLAVPGAAPGSGAPALPAATGLDVPPVPGLPGDGLLEAESELDAHRRAVALESRARHEAYRIFKSLPAPEGSAREAAGPEEPPRVWILAGPGPLGATAMAIARHLDTVGVPAGVQQFAARDKLRPVALREYRTLEAARLPLVLNTQPQPLEGVSWVVAGVEWELLAEARRVAAEAAFDQARAQGLTAERLSPFDPHYTPPAPTAGDVRVPIPETPLTQEEARMLDALAQNSYSMSGAALMENAGYGAAREAYLRAHKLAQEKGDAPPRVAVVCGRGNNGGDGLVVARLLHHWGLAPAVFLLGVRKKLTEDARRNMELLESCGVHVTQLLDGSQIPALVQTLSKMHLVVDGLLGTGLAGRVRGPAAVLIQALNLARKNGAKTLALDCPSGLECNRGEPLGVCVQADVTVTFVALKHGLLRGQGPQLCGEVVLAPIGLPRDIYRRLMTLTPAQVAEAAADVASRPATEEPSESGTPAAEPPSDEPSLERNESPPAADAGEKQDAPPDTRAADSGT